MKRVLKIFLFIIFVIITTCYLYFVVPLVLDGIWNYGFGFNIGSGLIPYKEFNMIIPPLFPIIVSFFTKIFGNRFIIYYFVISIIVVSIFFISYKKIGWKAILIYFMIILYPHNGYNTFSLLLLFILLNIITDKNNNDLLIAIIISMMFLTKQTLGLFVIPSIIYSKKKKKVVVIYIISCLILVVYLLLNNSLFQFIDYCFLGMFDFTGSNNTGINLLLFLEIGLCFYMIYNIIKSKFNNKQLVYILLFQIISFPIVDNSHFVLTISPFILYIYNNYTNKHFLYFFSILVIFFIIGFNIYIYTGYNNILYRNNDSFISYKAISQDYISYFNNIEEYCKIYKGYKLFLLDTRAYVGKLEFNKTINKYDLINDGNMGYNGSKKYIKEIDDYCDNNRCLFIINAKEGMEDINQSNKEIIRFVMKKYYNISSTGLENIYVNKM